MFVFFCVDRVQTKEGDSCDGDTEFPVGDIVC